MSEKSQEKDRESAKKGGMIVLIAGVCVIIVLLAAIVALLLRRAPGGDEGPVVADDSGNSARGVLVVDEDEVEDLIAGLSEQDFIPPGQYEVRMNTEWYFPDGSSPGEDIWVENAVTNTNDVYFDLVLLDEMLATTEDEEVIYASPIIPRGATLEDVTLDKDLDAGDYACAVVYHLVDDDHQETISTLRVGVNVHVAS